MTTPDRCYACHPFTPFESFIMQLCSLQLLAVEIAPKDINSQCTQTQLRQLMDQSHSFNVELQTAKHTLSPAEYTLIKASNLQLFKSMHDKYNQIR
jgi:hypothetical protein